MISTLRTHMLLIAPCCAGLAFWLLPEHYLDAAGNVQTLGLSGRACGALALWMALWWLTEAVDLAATALLPLLLLPLLGGVPIRMVAQPYADDLIFLFMGGFMISLAMERCNLHRRIALTTIHLFGQAPARVVAGFMTATAFLSMWLSNTATTLMLLPIASSILPFFVTDENRQEGRQENPFALCLLLGVAYAASIGGTATIIGTPPNTFLASFLRENLQRDLDFAQWLLAVGPLALCFLLLTWLLLTRILFSLKNTHFIGSRDEIAALRRELGPWRSSELLTGTVFVLAVLLWVFRPLLQGWHLAGGKPLAGLSDAGVAMLAGLLLLTVPLPGGQKALDWKTAEKLPWGILLLFGGGLSLAQAIDKFGLGSFLANQVAQLNSLPALVLMLLVITLVIFLTELTSNLATTATFVPLLAALAPQWNMSPLQLCLPATIAASFAFMLPVATAPNAIVFSTGLIPGRAMSRAGLLLNLAGIAIIFLFMVFWTGPRLLDP
jgi:sodium-dependent dicarboxylate transporter 2/3/5